VAPACVEGVHRGDVAPAAGHELQGLGTPPGSATPPDHERGVLGARRPPVPFEAVMVDEEAQPGRGSRLQEADPVQ
jgi:hypothetical protein